VQHQSAAGAHFGLRGRLIADRQPDPGHTGVGNAMPQPLLEITDLSATYIENGQQLLALEHLNMHVDPGEFVCLIGPSGSGKSSLLDVITGLFVESNGKVRIYNQEHPPDERPGLTSYMRQRDLLMPWRTAVEN